LQTGEHQYPQEGYKIKNMYKGETCQSDAQESVISQTSGGLVLIGLKQNEIESDDTQLSEITIKGREQKACHTREYQKGY
jgi:hypothetical protein